MTEVVRKKKQPQPAQIPGRRLSDSSTAQYPPIIRTASGESISVSNRPQNPAALGRVSLTKIDVFKKRNPAHVSILVDILAQGYSYTYKELFNLLKEEEEAERLYPSRVNYVLMKNDRETLSSLAVTLSKCEESSRVGNFKQCYKERAQLGKHFKQVARRTLALHFYRTAALESLKISDEGEQVECQAKADIEYGQRLLEEKMLTEAKTYLETAYEILVVNEKSNSDLFRECCKILSTINLEMGNEVVKRANKITKVAKSLYNEAYKLIRKSNDHRMTQAVCIQLSEIFTQYNQPKTSRKFLTQVRSKTPNTDLESYCKACRELAKSLSSSDQHGEALKVLARSARDIDAVKRREGYSTKMAQMKGMNCNLQCKIYNDKGSYGKATQAGHNALYHLQNASKSKQTLFQSQDMEASASSAKVNLAIARAHAHLADYADLLQQNRGDYDQPMGLLGSKMRGLTAEILYFDQNSNVKQRIESHSRIPVTSRKSSVKEGDDTDKTIRVELNAHSRVNSGNASNSNVESCWFYDPGWADQSQNNASALSDFVLSGLFPSDTPATSESYYYEYEYDSSDSDLPSDSEVEDTTEIMMRRQMDLSKQLSKRVTEPTTVHLKENEDFFETFKEYQPKEAKKVDEDDLERDRKATPPVGF